MSDHRLLGNLESAVVASGSFSAQGTGSLIVRAPMGDVTITNCVAQIAKDGATPVTGFTLKQGCELLGIKSITVSGNCQIFWTK